MGDPCQDYTKDNRMTKSWTFLTIVENNRFPDSVAGRHSSWQHIWPRTEAWKQIQSEKNLILSTFIILQRQQQQPIKSIFC